jgi:hypothetical protein
MDIIFQSGDFYYGSDNFWFSILEIGATFIAIIASSWTSVWIFKQGIKRQRKAQQESVEKKLQMNIRLFQLSLEETYDVIRKQSGFVIDFIRKIHFDSLQPIRLNHTTFDSIERLKMFKQDLVLEMFEYYDLTADDYSKTLGNIDYLSNLTKYLIRDDQKQWDHFLEISQLAIEKKRNLLDLMAKLIRNQKLNDAIDELGLTLNGIMKEYYINTSEKPDLVLDQFYLVDPIKEYVVKTFYEHENVIPIIDANKQLGDLIASCSQIRYYYAEDLYETLPRIKRANKEVKRVLDLFTNRF